MNELERQVKTWLFQVDNLALHRLSEAYTYGLPFTALAVKEGPAINPVVVAAYGKRTLPSWNEGEWQGYLRYWWLHQYRTLMSLLRALARASSEAKALQDFHRMVLAEIQRRKAAVETVQAVIDQLPADFLTRLRGVAFNRPNYPMVVWAFEHSVHPIIQAWLDEGHACIPAIIEMAQAFDQLAGGQVGIQRAWDDLEEVLDET